MPYVFCKEEGDESAKTAQADRARHPDEVRRSNLHVGTSNFSIIKELKLNETLQIMNTVSASLTAY